MNIEILYSTIGEELSKGAFFYLLIQLMHELNFVGIKVAIDDVFLNMVTKDTL